MTETADVSVIVPAWQAAATLDRNLESLARQTLPPREIIVVDDGSDDGTHLVAESWRQHLPSSTRLIVLCQPNAGAGAARNAGLKAASCRWVAFLDADDEWLADKLSASLPPLHENKDLLFVAHDMLVVDRQGHESYMDCCRHFNDHEPFTALFKRGFVATSTVIADRQAILGAGGFDITLRAAQDYDLWLRLAGQGPFVVLPKALTRYHITDDSITAQVDRRLACSRIVMCKHAASLAARSRSWLRVLAFRSLVIHYEAANAHLVRGRPFAALTVALGVPRTLLVSLSTLVPAKVWNWGLTTWVVVALAAYFIQFGDIANRIVSKIVGG